MSTRLVPAILAVGLVAGACSVSGSIEVPTPSSHPPTGSPSPSTSTSTGIPTAVGLHRGTARIRVTGRIRERRALPVVSSASTWQEAPGLVVLRYLNRSADALLIQGTTPRHAAPTSAQLVLSIVLQVRHALVFISSRGECRVTIVRSTPRSVSGRFSCGKLTFHRTTIRATGTFTGSG